MREHIFRAKTKDTGEWVEGFPVGWQNESGDISMVDKRFGACIDSDGNLIMLQAPFVVKVDPETVCEFTGMFSELEKTKAYENDMLKRDNSIGIIKYKKGMFYIDWIADEDSFSDALDIQLRYAKIIGNIFDRAEPLST